MKSCPINFRKVLQHAIILLLFLIIDAVYFYPVFEGKTVQQSDMINAKGGLKECVDFHEKTGQYTLWTCSMFGGMPAYLIMSGPGNNIFLYLNKILRFGMPYYTMALFFTYLLGMYVLLNVLRINPWISFFGALAFAFSSYNIIIIAVGHVTKAYAIGYMAPMLAGLILVYRKRFWEGISLSALTIGMLIYYNHLQITYYLIIMIFLFLMVYLISSVREKTIKDYATASALMIIPVILALAPNIAKLWTTYEYGKVSIRGKTELTSNKDNQTSGLEKDYATAWSYGIGETMTLLIPDFYGGASHGELNEHSITYKTLVQNNIPNSAEIVKQLPTYWGKQPGTSGPVYVGAIVVFLFVISLFIVKGKFKWWLLICAVLSILLAWGKNFMPLTNFFLDHVPLYNKFRAVSMTLVIAGLAIPLLAIVGFQKMVSDEKNPKSIIRVMKYTFYVIGLILLVFLLFPRSLLSFTGPYDTQLGLPDWLMTSIRADRVRLLQLDALRSLIFISLAFLAIWLFLIKKIKLKVLIPVMALLILCDMWPVAKRYLNAGDFVRDSLMERPFTATKADKFILQDKSPSYRVVDLTEDLDKSARTSYFHKNIGGYHGAKLRRYQEFIDYHLGREKNGFTQFLSTKPTGLAVNHALTQTRFMDMLNTRYLIYNHDADPIINDDAMGNAWFVDSIEKVDNADQEIMALKGFDPLKTAVIDKRFDNLIGQFMPGKDTSRVIHLLEYYPNKLIYEARTSKEALAVFSEIYYYKGWKALIDGVEAPIFRVDYILRGMMVPPGNHRIEFSFRPKSYYTGEKYALAGSLIFIILMLTSIGVPMYRLWPFKKE
jgi:hypothetical protein